METIELGNIGIDGCACGEIKCEKYTIETHCHKTITCKKCPYSGVHYDKPAGKEHAGEIASYIREAYRTDVKVVKGLFRK